MTTDALFDVRGKVVVLTGAGGVLVSAMAGELARRGAKIALFDLSQDAANVVAARIRAEGGDAMAVCCNVLDKPGVDVAVRQVVDAWGRVDVLVNGAGGNHKDATTRPDLSFFDLPADAIKFVVDLNLLGTLFPSQAVGRVMMGHKAGVILNISSMNSFRPLTRIVGYSAAKAAINNLTQWMAVYMAQNCSPAIRVNAIAPGFFETIQNKFLLREEADGRLTARGRQIVEHTPMGRFGAPEDLLGTLIWLVSPASAFVTGVVVPVDGGFSAFSGV